MAAAARGRVFHPNALLDLADQLQCTSIPRSYALTFLEMLEARVARIVSATGSNDAETAMDAVLSLKVNAHMVGARSMEEICDGLEQSILNGDMPVAARDALVLPANIGALKTALTDFLSHALNELGANGASHPKQQPLVSRHQGGTRWKSGVSARFRPALSSGGSFDPQP